MQLKFAKRALAMLPAACTLGLIGMTSAAQAQETVVETPPGSKTTVVQEPGGQTTITVSVNSDDIQFDKSQMPMMMNGRVMIPLRGVVEKLGGTIQYEPKSKVITGAQPDVEKQFRLRVGSNDSLVNGQPMSLDAPPRVVRGITYVPLRFVSEALGAEVEWNPQTHAVKIMAAGYSADVKTNRTAPPATQPQ